MRLLTWEPLPRYLTCSFRQFYQGERHVNRVSGCDVLLLLFRGTLYFSEDGGEREVSEGEYYIQEAGKRQQGLRPCDAPFYFYLHFQGQWGDRPPGLVPRGRFSPDALLPLCRELAQLEQSPAPSPLAQYAAFYSLLRQLEQQQQPAAPWQRLAEAVERELTASCPQPISLRQLGESLQYSQDHLIRVFRRRYGVTPHQYLTLLRLGQAKQLMLTTDRPAAQVAADCGFSDYSSFHRAFTKAMGATPQQWRRSRWGETQP